MKRGRLLLLLTCAPGCAETARDRVDVPLFVAGTELSEPVVATGDVRLAIDRAELAFGPLYLCAGNTAGDLCDAAVLEWLDSVVIDTTSASPARAGDLSGVSGPVRSWMYDLGSSSQLTRAEPFVLEAAQHLDGASFVVEGRADAGGLELPFSASIPVRQSDDTELGVPVVRKSSSQPFSRDVGPDEAGLLVRFDPRAWLRGVDFRPYLESEACSSGGPARVCLGDTEKTCAEDGTETSSLDCRERGERCIPREGCAQRLTVTPDTEAFRALRNALLSGGRPEFEWDFVP